MRFVFRSFVFAVILLPAFQVFSQPIDNSQNADQTTPKHFAHTFDETLFLSINHWGYSSPGLDPLMSDLSASATYVIVGVPLGMYAYGWWKHDRHAAISGAAIAVGEGVGGLMGQILKIFFQRDRPYLVLNNVRTPSGGAGGYSFPSGHATGVWALAGGLYFHYPTWQVAIPAAVYATAVSISRPYLGVHYPGDLLAGAILGVGCSYLVYHYENDLANVFSWAFPKDKTASHGSNTTTDDRKLHFMPVVSPAFYGIQFSY